MLLFTLFLISYLMVYFTLISICHQLLCELGFLCFILASWVVFVLHPFDAFLFKIYAQTLRVSSNQLICNLWLLNLVILETFDML